MSNGARSPAGYSGTPLDRKLGLKEGMVILPLESPREYSKLVGTLPEGARIVKRAAPTVDLVHLFATRASTLRRRLPELRRSLRPDAVLWISWPKRLAKVDTDITEDVIRQIALPLGFVDVKVCALDAIWSGLKLVVRRELR
jgi:hypothetical protein